MNNTLRLSIIVPVYNVGKYLRRCIDSLFRQNLTEDEYEIILVNDGSTDDSLSIAESIASEHSNIRIISQKNGGLSAARNTGLRNANGNYVWFVDSDDFVEPYTVLPLLDNAETNCLDVQCFNLQLYFDNGNVQRFNNSSDHDGCILNGSDFICNVGMPPAAWVAFYKRAFLNSNRLTFKEGILHEDQEFTPRAYYLAQRIAYHDIVVINYYQREGSIMKSVNPLKCPSLLKVCDSLYEFKKKFISDNSTAANIFNAKIAFAFSQALAHYTDNTTISLHEFKCKPYYPIRCNNRMSRKERIKAHLMNISLPLYLFVSKHLK